MNKIFKTKYDVTTGQTKVVSELANNRQVASRVEGASVGVGQSKCGMFFGGMLGAFKVLALALALAMSGVSSAVYGANVWIDNNTSKESGKSNYDTSIWYDGANKNIKDNHQELILLADKSNKAGAESSIENQHAKYAVIVGSRAVGGGIGATSIGYKAIVGENTKGKNIDNAKAQGTAVGYRTFARGAGATSLGNDTVAWGDSSIAIGSDGIGSADTKQKKLPKDIFRLFLNNAQNFNYTDEYPAVDFRFLLGISNDKKNEYVNGNGELVGKDGQNITKDGQYYIRKNGNGWDDFYIMREQYGEEVFYKKTSTNSNTFEEVVDPEEIKQIKQKNDYKQKKEYDEKVKSAYEKYLDETGENKKKQEEALKKKGNNASYDNRKTHTWARGKNSIAVGARSVAYGDYTTAIGTFAIAFKDYSTAIGSDTIAFGKESLVIGNKSYVYADRTVGVGTNVQAINDGAMVYGSDSYAGGRGSLAIGNYALANIEMDDNFNKDGLQNNNGFTLTDSNHQYGAKFDFEELYEKGNTADIQAYSHLIKPKTTKQEGTEELKAKQSRDALGYNQGGIAIGSYSVALGDNTLTIGRYAYAKEDSAIAIGRFSFAKEKDAFAIGSFTRAIGQASIALGNNTYSGKQYSVAIGYKAQSQAESGVALGIQAGVDKDATGAMAIGNNAEATMKNSVALGYKSKTDYTEENLKKNPYTPQGALVIPTSESVGVISVGANGFERRVVNVAAGSKNTDAVNVAQLRALESRMNLESKKKSLTPFFGVEQAKDDGEAAKITKGLEAAHNYERYVTLAGEYAKLLARKNYGEEKFDDTKLAEIKKEVESLGKQNNIETVADDLKKIVDELGKNGGSRDEKELEKKIKEIEEAIKTVDTEDKKKQVIALTEAEIDESNYKGNLAIGKDSIAIGFKAKAEGDESVAIGKGATVAAGAGDSVAIGAGSKAEAKEEAKKKAEIVISKENKKEEKVEFEFKGGVSENANEDNKKSVFSVGSQGKERIIKYVAAGAVSEISTDAINGSQLYAVITKGLNIAGDEGTGALSLGSTLTIKAGNTTVKDDTPGTETNYSPNNIRTAYLPGNKELLIGIKETPTFQNVIIESGIPDENAMGTDKKAYDKYAVNKAYLDKRLENVAANFTVKGNDAGSGYEISKANPNLTIKGKEDAIKHKNIETTAKTTEKELEIALNSDLKSIASIANGENAKITLGGTNGKDKIITFTAGDQAGSKDVTLSAGKFSGVSEINKADKKAALKFEDDSATLSAGDKKGSIKVATGTGNGANKIELSPEENSTVTLVKDTANGVKAIGLSTVGLDDTNALVFKNGTGGTGNKAELKVGGKFLTFTPNGTGNAKSVKISNLADGQITGSSTEAITGKQLNDLAGKLGVSVDTSSKTGFGSIEFTEIKGGANPTTKQSTFKGAINDLITAVNKGLTFKGNDQSLSTATMQLGGTLTIISSESDTGETGKKEKDITIIATPNGTDPKDAGTLKLTLSKSEAVKSGDKRVITSDAVATALTQYTKTSDIGNMYLKIDGTNIGGDSGKKTFGQNVGLAAINLTTDKESTQLVQAKALIAYLKGAGKKSVKISDNLETKAEGEGSISIGDKAVSKNEGSIALGYGANALNTASISIGQNSIVTGLKAVSLGSNNTVGGDSSIVLGETNTVAGVQSLVMGTNNNISGRENIVFGSRNTVSANSNIVFGSDITIDDTNITDAIVLGNGSTAEKTALSIGNEKIKRRIANVAEPTKEYDAANKKYVDARGLKFKGDDGQEQLVNLDKLLTIDSSESKTKDGNTQEKDIKTSVTKEGDGAKLTLTLNKADKVSEHDERAVTSKAVHAAIGEVKNSLANAEISYKANGKGDKMVKLTDGFDFIDGSNTSAEVGEKGVVKFNLNKELKDMISFETSADNKGNKAKLDQSGLTVGYKDGTNGGDKSHATYGKDGLNINGQDGQSAVSLKVKNANGKGTATLEFAKDGENGTGSITGLKDLDEKSTGDMAANKNYVDSKVAVLNGNRPFDYYVDGKKVVKGQDGKFHKEGEPNKALSDDEAKNVVIKAEPSATPIGISNVKSGLGVTTPTDEHKKQLGELAGTVKEKVKALGEKTKDLSEKATKLADLELMVESLKQTVDTLPDGEAKDKIREELKNYEPQLSAAKEAKENAKKAVESARDALIAANKDYKKQYNDYSKATEKVADLVKTDSKANPTNVITVGDLQAVARAGLNFEGNDGIAVHQNVGETLTLKGEGEFNSDNSAVGNIKVEMSQDGKGLEVKLSDQLKNMTSFETREVDGRKSTLNSNGLKVVSQKDGEKGISATYGAEAVALEDKGKNNKATITAESLTFADNATTQNQQNPMPKTVLNKNGLTVTGANGEIKINGENGIITVPDIQASTNESAVVNKKYVDTLQRQADQKLSNLNNKLDMSNKELRAGIAGALATSGLPMSSVPGKSMFAASAGSYKGQSAVALGYSRVSDNGKITLRLQGTRSSTGDVGGSVGVGYQW